MVYTRLSPRGTGVPAFRKKTGNFRGFALLELLIVVLLLSALMAVALPFYLRSISDSQLNVSRTNMQSIAVAVQSARIKRQELDYSSLINGGVTTTNLPDLNGIPHCPNGGAYTLAQGSTGDSKTFRVKCGPNGHGQFEFDNAPQILATPYVSGQGSRPY